MFNQIPLNQLPDGTALEVMLPYSMFLVPHQGILQREWTGRIMILENSKKHGRALATTFEDFSEGHPVKIVHIPETIGESLAIIGRARNDIARGVVWTVVDNCQDFVSRALTGKSGSRTRDGLVLLALFGLVIGGLLAG